MNPKIILITGCSTGIGYDAAITLAQRGHRVIATCRQETDVKKLLSAGLDAFLLDVSDSDSICKSLEQILLATNGRLDVLINNAGYGQAGALEDVSRDTLRKQFETNVFGLMELTQKIIPIMRGQGHGRIINVSSILGIISMPFRGAYNASKYAVEGLSDTLRLELNEANIQVITIAPGPIESKFRDNVIDGSLKNIDMVHSHFAKRYQQMLGSYREKKADSFFTLRTEAVINKFIHAIESKRPKPKYLVTFPAHLLAFLKRILSIKMLDRLLGAFSEK